MEAALRYEQVLPDKTVPDYTTDKYYYGYRIIIEYSLAAKEKALADSA